MVTEAKLEQLPEGLGAEGFEAARQEGAANSASMTPSPTRWVNRLALRLSFRDKFGSDLHERHVGILRKLA